MLNVIDKSLADSVLPFCVFLCHPAGWLLHRWPEEGGEGERGRALELLREASHGKPDCGETWYLLGRSVFTLLNRTTFHPLSLLFCRVLMTQRKCHEAFAAYQKAIHYPSKVSPANTWHSIGYIMTEDPPTPLYPVSFSLPLFLSDGAATSISRCSSRETVSRPISAASTSTCSTSRAGRAWAACMRLWSTQGEYYQHLCTRPTFLCTLFSREALICYQNAMTAFAKKGVRSKCTQCKASIGIFLS